MKRFEMDTTILAVREDKSIVSSRKTGPGKEDVETVYSPMVWVIVTGSVGYPPIGIVCQRKPDVKIGQQCKVVLEVEEQT